MVDFEIKLRKMSKEEEAKVKGDISMKQKYEADMSMDEKEDYYEIKRREMEEKRRIRKAQTIYASERKDTSGKDLSKFIIKDLVASFNKTLLQSTSLNIIQIEYYYRANQPYGQFLMLTDDGSFITIYRKSMEIASLFKSPTPGVHSLQK